MVSLANRSPNAHLEILFQVLQSKIKVKYRTTEWHKKGRLGRFSQLERKLERCDCFRASRFRSNGEKISISPTDSQADELKDAQFTLIDIYSRHLFVECDDDLCPQEPLLYSKAIDTLTNRFANEKRSILNDAILAANVKQEGRVGRLTKCQRREKFNGTFKSQKKKRTFSRIIYVFIYIYTRATEVVRYKC